MIDIIISNTSDTPIYQQMFEQISSQIIKGHMEINSSLPSIRTAAKELRVSIITVKKAWEELERSGFIYTMVGRGCFVAELTSKDIQVKRSDLINEKMKVDIEYYKNLGLSVEEITELVKRHY
ncbi:MAG: GntR family transcriptional regulator [Vallitaleaceae bacterium]|jgi:GntR family transcriptional regulator|nr:GntR family transcriptional regulator [Vallitaleaceae bacterium]